MTSDLRPGHRLGGARRFFRLALRESLERYPALSKHQSAAHPAVQFCILFQKRASQLEPRPFPFSRPRAQQRFSPALLEKKRPSEKVCPAALDCVSSSRIPSSQCLVQGLNLLEFVKQCF